LDQSQDISGSEVDDGETEDVVAGLDSIDETVSDTVDTTEAENDSVLEGLDNMDNVDSDDTPVTEEVSENTEEVPTEVPNEFEDIPVTEEVSENTEETPDRGTERV